MDKIFRTFTTINDGNLAYHTGDKVSVDKNRLALANRYDFDISKLCYMEQIHSNIVDIVDDRVIYRCDGLVTDRVGTTLLVVVADCIPIVFYDPKGVIAVAHAGREGTFTNISSNVIDTMVDKFGSNPLDIKIEFGASIQKCCYEVSSSIAQEFRNIYPDYVEGRYIDLQAINYHQLISKGVLAQNIIQSDICTKCSNSPYFSYRLDNSCGRFGGLVSLVG